MAIMVGTRTVLLDNPKLLTTRWSGRNPIRITLDRHGVLPLDSKIFSADAETIAYRDNTQWEYILQDLAQRNIHSVLVEGGSTLLQHIIDSGIFDEVHIEISNQRIGNGVKAPRFTPRTQPKVVDNHQIYVERFA
jgi:diaminohydroxyphosphoribosylaminopyrimidine deaminase/5-amino-6-(5-phosphoribosylamino)uracil reductase